MFTSFFVRVNGKLLAFPYDEVLYITAKNNYCEIVTTKGKALVYASLASFEEKLPDNLFCRVHRSHIIAIGKISSFEHNHVKIGGQTLPISKAGFEAISKRVLIISSELENKLRHKVEVMNTRGHLKK